MTLLDVSIPTPDGTCTAHLAVPEGDGPWPGVIMFPDAGGARKTMDDMAERLAKSGFAVLVPDIYYRDGGYEPFSMETVFSDPEERKRLGALMGSLTSEAVATDVAAYADALVARPEVVDGPIGTTGYCMGGRMSLLAAGHLGEKVGAAGSFHGGRLAPDGDPSSPHLLAGNVKARVYVGAAENDGSFPEEQAERLAAAYDAAGVTHVIETYPAAHGWCMTDFPVYDEACAERHWDATVVLFSSLKG